jgi:TonB family protein
LASKIVILPLPTQPEEEQFVVKLIDMPVQLKKNISKRSRKAKLIKKPKKVITTKQDSLKQLPPPPTSDRPKPDSPPPILEKPILPIPRYEAHIPQNFFKAGKEDLVHSPQIAYKEVLSANPKDISTYVGEPGQMAPSSHLSPTPKSGQGIEISGLMKGDEERYGFKQPAEALAIGDSFGETKNPLIGTEYISLDSKDPDLAPYLSYIKERILQFWRYPEEAQPGMKGQVGLAFTVDRDGNVSGIKIVSSSKYKVLDKGVLEAIKRAAPFKPVPIEIKEKSLPLLGTFLYNKPGYYSNQPKN